MGNLPIYSGAINEKQDFKLSRQKRNMHYLLWVSVLMIAACTYISIEDSDNTEIEMRLEDSSNPHIGTIHKYKIDDKDGTRYEYETESE